MAWLGETKSPQKKDEENTYKGPQYKKGGKVIVRLSFDFVSKDVSRRRDHLEKMILTEISTKDLSIRVKKESL